MALTALAQEAPWRPLGAAEGLPSEDVLDLCASGPERIWAATAAGLCRIEARGITVVRTRGIPRRLAPAPEGGVYVLYEDAIARIGGCGDRIPLPVGPKAPPPSAMASERNGTLWLAVGGRLYRHAPDGPWERSARTTMPPGSDAPVICHGEVWKPTRGRGILRQRLRPRFEHIAVPNAARVNCLALAPDGALWCGTERGVTRFRGAGIRSFPSAGGVALGPVTALAVDGRGRVWVGSGSAFKGIWRREDGRWTHLDAVPGFVHRITVDPAGTLWFAVLSPAAERPGPGRGAWYFSDETFHPAPANVDLPSARVYDVVARDPGGVLWFATLRGLAAYEGPGRVRRYEAGPGGLRGEKVWCLAAARDGSLWIGYQLERGVSRIAQGTITDFDVDDGLCDGNVWSIVEGRPGVLWFATGAGLSRYDGLRWSCFRSEDGLGSAAIWPLLPLPDGGLWIGTLGAGLVRMHAGDDAAPICRPRQRRYRGRAKEPLLVAWSGNDTWYDTPAGKLWYRRRLDGGRWSKAERRTSLGLRLDQGRHVLEVQAIDRFGNVSERPARIEIVVERDGRLPWIPLGLGALLVLAFGALIGRRFARRGS